MRKMLRHRLLNFVSGVKSANVLLASELDERLRPPEREYFAMIQKECDLLAGMTERIEALFAALPPPAPASLKSVFDTVLVDLHALFPMAEIALEYDPGCSGLASRAVCAFALKTAVVETVSNAYEFSRKPVLISVSEAGETCVIRVIDQGSCMSEELYAMAFEPFFSTRPRHVGVGLSIARRYVSDRGGSMAITSDEDGNCIEICLPCMQA